MKKSILTFLLITPLISFSQPTNFVIKDISVIEPIVIEVEGKSISELYAKAFEWLNLTYKNPESVIKGKVENDFVRFSGFKQTYASTDIGMGMTQYYDLKYTMRIDFKEGKYRFSLESYGIVYPPTQYTSSSEITLETYERDGIRNKKGEIKKAVLQRAYDSQAKNLLKEINALNASLYSYLTGKTKELKDDW